MTQTKAEADKEKEEARLEKEKKIEDARLEEASKERIRLEGIESERAEEAKIASYKGLKARQKYLDGLLNTLHAEGVNSIGDVENKLAKVNKDVEDLYKLLSTPHKNYLARLENETPEEKLKREKEEEKNK